MTGLEAVRAMIGKVDAMTAEMKMVKYERKKYYDNYGSGNYTEDKSENFTKEITEKQASDFAFLWEALGATHYETSKAHFYEIQTDARHVTQYILHK